MSVRGIDVSSHQGSIDWGLVATDNIDFAFIKATEDSGYANPYFVSSWNGAKNAGIRRGAYHYARPEGNDAVDEAEYFVDIVQGYGGLEEGDMLALDIESGSGDLGQWALDFLRHVESRVGFKPLVYTGAWFSDPHGFANKPELADYGLWLAAYTAGMPPPPQPWPFVAFWQHSDRGRVKGIVGNVDMNVFNGPVERLALYGKPAVVEPAVTLEQRVAALEEYIARMRGALEVKA